MSLKKMPPLPAITSHEYALPSNGKKIKYRLMVASEQKILMTAYHSINSNPDNMFSIVTNAVSDILDACILTPGVSTATLPQVDIDALFVQIRINSVGSKITWPMLPETSECDCTDPVEVSFDLNKTKIVKEEDFTSEFDLGHGYAISMTLPTRQRLEKIDGTSDNAVTALYEVMGACVDQIVMPDGEVTDASEYDVKSLTEWLLHFPQDKIKSIEDNFFAKTPRIECEVSWMCPKCNKEHKKVFDSVIDFFI